MLVVPVVVPVVLVVSDVVPVVVKVVVVYVSVVVAVVESVGVVVACQHYASSGCAAARQHKVAEVACSTEPRERTLDGGASDLPPRVAAAPLHQRILSLER